MVDTLALGASAEMRESSNLSFGTKYVDRSLLVQALGCGPGDARSIRVGHPIEHGVQCSAIV